MDEPLEPVGRCNHPEIGLVDPTVGLDRYAAAHLGQQFIEEDLEDRGPVLIEKGDDCAVAQLREVGQDPLGELIGVPALIKHDGVVGQIRDGDMCHPRSIGC